MKERKCKVGKDNLYSNLVFEILLCFNLNSNNINDASVCMIVK